MVETHTTHGFESGKRGFGLEFGILRQEIKYEIEILIPRLGGGGSHGVPTRRAVKIKYVFFFSFFLFFCYCIFATFIKTVGRCVVSFGLVFSYCHIHARLRGSVVENRRTKKKIISKRYIQFIYFSKSKLK